MKKLLTLAFIAIVFLSLTGANIIFKGKRIDNTNPFSNADAAGDLFSTYSMYSQTYTSGGGVIDSVDVQLFKIGSPTGTATVRVYSVSTNLPTGSSLAESDTLDVSTVATGATAPADLVTYRFTFSGANRIALSTVGSYTTIAIVIRYAGGDGSNKLKIGYDSSASEFSGRQGYFDTIWRLDSSTADMVFQVNVYR